MLSDGQIELIRRYCADKPVEVVYLFGSQAEGMARPDSDYDFGVLFEEGLGSSKRFDLRLSMMGELGSIVHAGDKIDVVDLNGAYIRFQYEAIKPRVLLYVRNENKKKVFEYRVLQRYFDEMYFMKRAARDQLRAIATGGFSVQ